jgi:hypothetical protein
MQLSSRGPSGPGTARGSSRGKTIRDAVATACQRDAPARLADRHRTPPLPRYQPRSGATPMARRAAARAVLGLDIRQGDRSGRTSAVVSASARHAFGVGATTRSPCLLHGLLPASPHGPRELRHARRPHTVEERDSTDIPARGSGAGVWRALGQTLACRPQQVRSGPVLGRSHLGVSRPRARCRVLAGSRGYPAARRALLLANLRTGPLSPPDTSFAISTPIRCVRTDAVRAPVADRSCETRVRRRRFDQSDLRFSLRRPDESDPGQRRLRKSARAQRQTIPYWVLQLGTGGRRHPFQDSLVRKYLA